MSGGTRAVSTVLMSIAVGLMVVSTSGCAPSRPRVFHVGILCGAEQFATTVDGFKDEMTRLGYAEGSRIRYSKRLTGGDLTVEKSLDELIRDKVDLIFAFPLQEAQKAKAATEAAHIPLIFAWCTTESTNLIESVSHPGGNTTGVRLFTSDLLRKRLEILLKLSPRPRRIWMPYDPSLQTVLVMVDVLVSDAAKEGVVLLPLIMTNVEALKAEIARLSALSDPGFDAILLLPDAVMSSKEGWALVRDFASAHRVAVAAQATFEVEDGAVFSYSPENLITGAQAAVLADKIFKGTPAGTIPVASAEGGLWVNLGSLQALGRSFPEGLLRQAVRSIQ